MENKLKPTLVNEKVILRPLELSDELELLSIAQEKELWIYGLKDLSIPNHLNDYIKSAIKARADGNAIVWVVIDVKTGKIAGCTRLAEISWKDERAQLGWTWIGKDYQGSGLNKAMKYEIFKYGFETLGLNRIEFKADERNLQSRKAIEKLGATYEGTLRAHLKIHNDYIRNTVLYSVLKSEWPEIEKNLTKL